MPAAVGDAPRHTALPSRSPAGWACCWWKGVSGQHVVCVPASTDAGGEKGRTTFNANASFFARGSLLKPCSIFNCLLHKLIFLALLTSKMSSPLAMTLFLTPAPPRKPVNHLQKIPKEERWLCERGDVCKAVATMTSVLTPPQRAGCCPNCWTHETDPVGTVPSVTGHMNRTGLASRGQRSAVGRCPSLPAARPSVPQLLRVRLVSCVGLTTVSFSLCG